jgi:hypothetical protein
MIEIPLVGGKKMPMISMLFREQHMIRQLCFSEKARP